MKPKPPITASNSMAINAQPAAPVREALRPDQTALFGAKIRPVLVDKCYGCHFAKAANVRGGLLLDTHEGVCRGGESGPVIVPGDPENSPLIQSIRYADEGLAMPPAKNGGKLPDAVIADFEQWVKMVAPAPREGDAGGIRTPKWDADKAKKWWSFQPLRTPAVPFVKDAAWPRSDIDRFVLTPLEQKGLTPVGDADKLMLLRRVSFDLTGLPPSPEMMQAFLSNKSPQAYTQLVDSLLAKPQFGERWGRHWLDVVRYAESSGRDLNVTFPHAWQYRDYVINAFNQKKPYDQFVREQIAGDLLTAKDARAKAAQERADRSFSSRCRSPSARRRRSKVCSTPMTRTATPRPFAWACRTARPARPIPSRCGRRRSSRSKAAPAFARSAALRRSPTARCSRAAR